MWWVWGGDWIVGQRRAVRVTTCTPPPPTRVTLVALKEQPFNPECTETSRFLQRATLINLI